MTGAFLLFSLLIILIAAEVFTNGVEWLGHRLNLSDGAVGSLLSAVGTALPETTIPLVAILRPGAGEHTMDVGVGAILGAPFMLGTLAFGLTGLAAITLRKKGMTRRVIMADPATLVRDLRFFLVIFSVAVLASFITWYPGRILVALFLLGAYLVYAWQTLHEEGTAKGEHPSPLYLYRRWGPPPLGLILLQLALALAAITWGSGLFVDQVEILAGLFGWSPLLLALVIAPLATELPEKFNSIIWIRRGKDTLALGNITGAMVFQSSIIPALGIVGTPWQFTPLALFSILLTLASTSIVYLAFQRRGRLESPVLLLGFGFYLIFVSALWQLKP